LQELFYEVTINLGETRPFIALLAMHRMRLWSRLVEMNHGDVDHHMKCIAEDAWLATTIMNCPHLCQPHGWPKDDH